VRHLGHTPPFRHPGGGLVDGSIAEVAYLRLGGLEQWVMIRGESVDNPPLIVLHGGPGLSETAFLRYFDAPLEKAFTVVYWDQRGAGRSYDHRIPRWSMTVAQFMEDLDELVEVIRERLGKKPVVIFGHSWGSALGALYAARFPQKVALYVGGAQIGDWASAESSSYAFALAEARRRGNDKALRQLTAMGPPPYSAKSLFAERLWVSRLERRMGPGELWKTGRAVLRAPESSLLDLVGAVQGFRFSLETMWQEVSRLNLLERVPALRMPVFFLIGSKDHWVPPRTSLDYFDALSAHAKKLVWFANSGHEMFIDEPARFIETMVQVVRPAYSPGPPAVGAPRLAGAAGRAGRAAAEDGAPA